VARRRDRLLQQPECHVRQGITGWRNPVARGRARPRPRPALPLSLEEREAISHGLAHRKTLTGIAGELGRSVSTVSRGVARNVGPNGYRAARADRLATTRTARPRAES
jgi:hypothetical protein